MKIAPLKVRFPFRQVQRPGDVRVDGSRVRAWTWDTYYLSSVELASFLLLHYSNHVSSEKMGDRRETRVTSYPDSKVKSKEVTDELRS